MADIPAVAEFLRQRKAAYQVAFSSAAGQSVQDDLATFCRAAETCFHVDPRIHAALEGRREVWLRIRQHLDLSIEQLMDLYGAVVPEPKGDHDDE